MIKRTLFFGNPAWLSLKDGQLVVERDGQPRSTVPVEDIGVIVLEHPQISLTHPLLAALLEAGAVLVTCDTKFHPSGLLWPIEGHFRQGARLRAQWEAPKPLMKQLWKSIVIGKLRNQSGLLKLLRLEGHEALLEFSTQVRSGDPDNLEARAAARYWKELFRPESSYRAPAGGFVRRRYGPAPNAWFNYGYAILRAATARALAASGLHPGIGLKHQNAYNPFPLADDLMEPYRPYVDQLVLTRWVEVGLAWNPDDTDTEEPTLQRADKAHLLTLLTQPVRLNTSTDVGPLQTMLERSASSLGTAFEEGDTNRLKLPRFAAP
jgi:CRISPR-associated protein Cas1